MADEQQQQPTPAPYPLFPLSETGLSRLYQEFGRIMHLSMERSLAIENLAQQVKTLQESTRAFSAKHGGSGCVKDETEADDPVTVNGTTTLDPTPMRAAGRARGG